MKTIDLNLAQELQSVCKEKNITMPESYMGWSKNHYNNPKNIYLASRRSVCFTEQVEFLAPAFLLCELMEWLPEYINEHDIEYLKFEKVDDHTIKYGKTGSTYAAYYEFHGQFASFTDPNPANACAKLLIWLIKEGLI